MNDFQLLEAYSAFQQYNAKNPDDPAGIFLLALAKWKIMSLSTYDSADKQELITLLDQVQEICASRSGSEKDSMFLNAAILGLRAQVSGMENQWWDTAQLGKRMKGQAEKLLETDPDYYPAYYLLGSFNYFADALPGYLKFLRSLVFLPGGDRTTGLKQLIVAYQKGGAVSAESGRTLAIIYTYFQRIPDYGVKMCDNLLVTYPRSYDVSLYKGVNLYFHKEWEKSLNEFMRLEKHLITYSQRYEMNRDHEIQIVPVYRAMERETRYWMSRNLIQLERYEEAHQILMDLANPPIHQPYWILRWIYLSLAQIEYHNQNPDAAEVWLEKVLSWKDIKDSTDKARLLKKKQGKVDPFDIDIR